ncbi:redox-regulated ATPase YchF [Candidatus Woesebacteria bacterium]|nr:redox-regulated ATPase YchF [Candidatus Woesebacteria bacterium]
MSLSVGIVGLPNVGKSTLFNALLKKQQAYVANFPFATIEPNIGIVPVPDIRLTRLSQVVKESEGLSFFPPEVPATVEFLDIAGLIAGAHKGEGLGNKFLSPVVVKIKDALQKGVPAREVQLNEEEGKISKQMSLLTSKPILVVLNISETDLKNASELEEKYANEFGINKDQVVAISAKTESELSELDEADQKVYLNELGVEKSGLERLIQKAFRSLGLITFLTAGEKEVRAWTIHDDSNAVAAAGEIHTDFMKKFIKADVIPFENFVEVGGWKNAKDSGNVRSEGRDYIVKDGDVIEFKIGT